MKKLALVAALSVLAVTAAVHAQASAAAPAPASAPPTAAPAPGAPAGPGVASSPAARLLDRALADLALRPEQAAAIEKLRAQFEESSASLRADLRARAVELRRMRSGGKADLAATEAKRAEFLAQQTKLRAEVDKLAAKIGEQLDPEQRAAFEKARAEMRANPQLERRPSVGAPPATAGAAAPPAAQV